MIRQQNLLRFSGIFSAVVAFGCATTTGAKECDLWTPHASFTETDDLGSGFVSFRIDELRRGTGFFGGLQIQDGTETSFVIFDCEKGDALNLTSEMRRQDGSVKLNMEQEVQAFLNFVPHPDEAATLVYLQERADEYGIPNDFSSYSGEETCGCKLFYPELRGDKTPYEAET